MRLCYVNVQPHAPQPARTPLTLPLPRVYRKWADVLPDQDVRRGV